MDSHRFDRFTRGVADRHLSRRAALRAGGAGLAAAIGDAGLADVEDATPVVAPEAETAQDAGFMVVQRCQSGAFVPMIGSADTFTLALNHGLGQTVSFPDRSARVFGATPTGQFLAGFPATFALCNDLCTVSVNKTT